MHPVARKGSRWLLASAAVLAAAAVEATEPIAFAEALVRLDANPGLAASLARQESAEAARDGARALRYPSIEIGATYARISDPIELDLRRLNGVLQGIDPGLPAIPNPVLQPDTFGVASARLTWPVFTGGRITAANRAAEAGLAAAGAQGDATRDSLLLDLVTRYHGVGVAAQALAVEDGTVDSLRSHLAHAQALEREGQIAKADRMRAEVALAQAETSRQQRSHALDMARAALASLLGMNGEPDPVTRLGVPPPLKELPALQDEALDANPVLRQLDAVVAQAGQGVRAARAEYWPTVAIIGNYEFASYHLPELNPEWGVLAMLKMPLFDGGERRSKVSSATAKLHEAEALRRDGEDKIRLLVRQRWLDCDDASRRVEVAARTVALARESLRMQRLAFDEGEARSIDVVDAENALAKARLGRLAARYDHALAWTALMLAAGRRGEVEREFSRGSTESDGDAY